MKTTCEIRVRFNEVDSLGIVWHGHYLKYFEDGREAFGRQFGLSYLDVKQQGYSIPIVKSSLEHKLPLKFGDLVTVETSFKNTRASKLVFCYRLLNAQGQEVCVGETTQVFIDLASHQMALSPPKFLEDWKQQYGILDA